MDWSRLLLAVVGLWWRRFMDHLLLFSLGSFNYRNASSRTIWFGLPLIVRKISHHSFGACLGVGLRVDHAIG
jgi:hypothetical protein